MADNENNSHNKTIFPLIWGIYLFIFMTEMKLTTELCSYQRSWSRIKFIRGIFNLKQPTVTTITSDFETLIGWTIYVFHSNYLHVTDGIKHSKYPYLIFSFLDHAFHCREALFCWFQATHINCYYQNKKYYFVKKFYLISKSMYIQLYTDHKILRKYTVC